MGVRYQGHNIFRLFSTFLFLDRVNISRLEEHGCGRTRTLTQVPAAAPVLLYRSQEVENNTRRGTIGSKTNIEVLVPHRMTATEYQAVDAFKTTQTGDMHIYYILIYMINRSMIDSTTTVGLCLLLNRIIDTLTRSFYSV